MKIQGAKKVHYDSGPNMTPLVDVVMVILIFLMLAGSFGLTEKYLVSDVPTMEKGAGGKTDKSPVKRQFQITVNQAGIFYTAKAGNFGTVDSSKDEAGAYVALYNIMRKERNDIESAGEKADDYLVLIYPSNYVTLKNLLAVEAATLQAGFKKVGFRVGGT